MNELIVALVGTVITFYLIFRGVFTALVQIMLFCEAAYNKSHRTFSFSSSMWLLASGCSTGVFTVLLFLKHFKVIAL